MTAEPDESPSPRPQPDQIRQATVHRFDQSTGAGAVISDDGVVVPFPPEAWASGPLRTLRVGQRLAVTVEESQGKWSVTEMTLVTFPH